MKEWCLIRVHLEVREHARVAIELVDAECTAPE